MTLEFNRFLPHFSLEKQISFFQKVYGALLSDESNMVSLIEKMQEYLEYDDVRYFTMKYALSDIQDKTEKQVRPVEVVGYQCFYITGSTVEPRSTTTSVTRPPRQDDQISPVLNSFLFNFH
jgi:hypothetical protein